MNGRADGGTPWSAATPSPTDLKDHGLLLALHLTLATAALAAAIYAVARTAGLADLGRRLGLAERSVRRGEGDPGLTDALREDEKGNWK